MFATVELSVTCNTPDAMLRLHLGEKLDASGNVDRQPPGTIRYRSIDVKLTVGTHCYRIAIPPDTQNTGPAAIPLPVEAGDVVPFRYCEIDANHATPTVERIHQLAIHVPFDDTAASFECSDATLNAVWQLCRHTIKATTFCGMYVDGDRERIPYEGDAYINQLSHYACDAHYQTARYTHEYLVQHPTWFADWNMHSVFMAWADVLYTGDRESVNCFYDDLVAKTLIDLGAEDGLISTAAPRPAELERKLHLFHARYIAKDSLQDLVDWPPGSFTVGGIGERDNHDMRPINTVINALHYRALVLMAAMARLIDRTSDADRFSRQAEKVRQAINSKLFDPTRGIYIDGEGSSHASLHSNMMPLAFGLVPPKRRDTVLQFVKSRGMACSVYGAQYLLEGLYDYGEAEYALSLMTSRSDRSWWHMLEQGSTMTLEAWAHRYKNNLDWNHAWGTAPINIIPRKLMGIEPVAPGYAHIRLRPQPASLTHVSIKVPTPLGPIIADYDGTTSQRRYTITVPGEMRVDLDDAVRQSLAVDVRRMEA
ncbi:alpha-L-rhamnosidase C-terminal domain-containing protein [Phycisphaerales bacterium AB-hyl4]|uniref:alpha-L-rhamnosidase n=1 Tax=Natronomicrosphaera hydrolytica TaxID=3242702 RepID=A0ABV4U6I4_9BACT